MSKKKKQRNPQIEAAYQQGRKDGLQLGLEHGRGQATMFFLDYLDNLNQVPGIGKKTAKKIGNHFMEIYGHDAEIARRAIKEAKEGKFI